MNKLSDDLIEAIQFAEDAIASAERSRKKLRRKTRQTDQYRDKRLESEKANLEAAMIPLRSAMGRLAFLRLSDADEVRLRLTSKRLQAERQKIKKMLGLVPWN